MDFGSGNRRRNAWGEEMTAPLFCSSVAILGAAIYATGHGKPLLGCARAIVYARAAGYFAAELLDGAKSRWYRWDECVSKAWREI
jgi:hypothetical protein